MRDLVTSLDDLAGLTIEKASKHWEDIVLVLSENKFMVIQAVWSADDADIEVARSTLHICCHGYMVDAGVMDHNELAQHRKHKDEEYRKAREQRRKQWDEAREARR